MSMPFYVAPEQFMKDKADFARKNIARGRPLIATTYADGILICAENTSKTLHKVSEIYDRIAFAGVGRYNEFDQLRRSGVQYADIKGFQFSREDVDARSLANLYAQHIGNVFTHEMKPLEVEILVAEVGVDAAGDQMFHILYDGSVVDEDRFSVLGGEAEAITGRMKNLFLSGWSLSDALKAASSALGGPDQSLAVPDLEVAVLARSESRRAFRRVEDGETAELLGLPLMTADTPPEAGLAKPGAGGELADLPDTGAGETAAGGAGAGGAKGRDTAAGSKAGEGAAGGKAGKSAAGGEKRGGTGAGGAKSGGAAAGGTPD